MVKVLLVVDEFFGWGVYGGFGAFTRKLGKELVKRGVEVEASVHRISKLQRPIGESEIIDGVKVTTLPRNKLAKFRNKQLYSTDADIIHSQSGKLDTYLTFNRNLDAKKLVTFQDLRTKNDLISIGQRKRLHKRLWAKIVERLFKKALKKADVIACQARLLKPKIREIYGIHHPITFLPNFVDIPNHPLKKSREPSVVWLGRLDPIKRPELCFEVAKKTPHVTFHILGCAHNGQRDSQLRREYKNVENLKFHGFQSGEIKEQILSESWMLINTSIYECLPVSFLEALSHKCALLSTRNPDGYTANFGAYASPTVSGLKDALDFLLRNSRWRGFGEKGCEHIRMVHSTEKSVDAHLKLYKELL